MHRLLERLDGAASTLVPLLYLAGLALGASAYFAGVILDANLAVGLALAVAAELHSFLQQRRVRAAWARLKRLPDDAPDVERQAFALRVDIAILAALLVFSAFNATAFAAATWRPSPGFLPPWLQIGIRGLVIPAFFFLSGFLTPLSTDASDQLRATSTEMLRRTLKAIGKQWKARLRVAQQRKADLAPVAIALMEDAGDLDGARRVRLIAQGIDDAEHPALQAALQEAWPSSEPPPLAVTPPANLISLVDVAALADDEPSPWAATVRENVLRELGLIDFATRALAQMSDAPDMPPDTPPDGPSGGPGTGLAGNVRSGLPTPMHTALTPLRISSAKAGQRQNQKPAAVRRREKLAADALGRELRRRAADLLDESPEMTANALMRAIRRDGPNISHRKAKWLREQWLVDDRRRRDLADDATAREPLLAQEGA